MQEVVIHFRWSPPAKSNGELAGYRVTYCRETSESQHRDCQNANVSPSATEFVARNVGTDDYYVFTVSIKSEAFSHLTARILIIIIFLLRELRLKPLPRSAMGQKREP